MRLLFGDFNRGSTVLYTIEPLLKDTPQCYTGYLPSPKYHVRTIFYHIIRFKFISSSFGKKLKLNLSKYYVVISIGSTVEPYYCAVNKVGETEYIGENDIDVKLYFASSGANIEGFQCRLVGEAEFTPCKFYPMLLTLTRLKFQISLACMN